jgi:hypothetical protein
LPHLAAVGPQAVARLTQGISPKHCASPAGRAEGSWRNALILRKDPDRRRHGKTDARRHRRLRAILEAGARELTHAVTELGLRGVFVESAKGALLPDAEEARPTFAAAAALGVPVFLHPVEDWNNLRGWTKDVQRSVFAPTVMITNCVAVIWLGGRGAIDAATVQLFAFAAPAVVLGTWAGLKLYGHLDEAEFRRVVLGLLMLSGIALLV